MPYFPGLDIVDSINQAITDSVNTAVAEANQSINGLVSSIAVAVNNTVGIKAATGTTADTLPDVHVWMETGIPWLKALDVTVTHPPAGSYDLGPAVIGLINYYGSALLAALTAEGGANVVNLPATPPTGYGGAAANDVASAVWAFQLLNSLEQLRTADSALTEILAFVDAWQHTGTIPVVGTGHFVQYTNRAWLYHWSEGITPPDPDYADIQADDTVLTWLTRTETTHQPWSQDASTGFCYTTVLVGEEYQNQIWCTLTDAELLSLGGYGGAGVTTTLPLWPGLAGVTLGTPVALSSNLTVAGPMQGVLINVTEVPDKGGRFTVGDNSWYFNVGQISFVTDNGEAEPWQYLSWKDAIYTPKTMHAAASCLIRWLSDAAGTATPWSVP